MANHKLRFIFYFILLVLSSLAPTAARAQGQPIDRAAGQPGEKAAAESLAVDELQPVPVPEPSEKALEYYRSGNWLWIVNHVWALLLTGGLAFSGASARIRSLAQRLGRVWFVTIGFYVTMYILIMFVLDLPLSYYQGYLRQHAYGLSNQTLGRWFRNSAVGLGVEMAVGFFLAWIPYLLLARSPRRWWLYTAILSVPFMFVTMLVMPICYDPLFNDFGPMKNKELERSILSLAERAGIEGSRVFEVDKSVDTKAVNAYVTGFLQTKRIVLWDTTIAKLNEKELLCVMGHEMGHYVLAHVVKSILLSTMVTLAGLFLVDWLGRRLIARFSGHLAKKPASTLEEIPGRPVIARFSGRLGFDQLSDVASLPLLLMLMQVAFLALSPVALAYSRYQEHEADRFALDLTRTNHSACTAFVKLQEENLSNPRPGLLVKIFRSSHPSIGDRIDFCNAYHPWLSKPSVSTNGADQSRR